MVLRHRMVLQSIAPPAGSGQNFCMRRNPLNTLVLLLLAALFSGCTATYRQPRDVQYDEDLIDGFILFAETVEPAQTLDLIGVSPQMQAFVDDQVLKSPNGYTRFKELMEKMKMGEFFINQYDPHATYTAAEAFARRKGNCLAYTNLFIALAREARLDAKFQLVKSRPEWDVTSGYLVRNNHINVLVDNVHYPGSPRSGITVDFNLVQAQESDDTRIVSDAHAASLYYANIGIDHLRDNNLRESFAHIKRAILEAPQNVDAWNNLAVLYSVTERFAYAERAYQTALALDPNDKTAIGGLGNSLLQQGREEQAQYYIDLAQKYRMKNAYYHFALAQQAYESEMFDDALAALNDAIRLKRSVSRFYGLRAKTAEKLGDVALVEDSIRLWQKYRAREQQPSRSTRRDRNRSNVRYESWTTRG